MQVSSNTVDDADRRASRDVSSEVCHRVRNLGGLRAAAKSKVANERRQQRYRSVDIFRKTTFDDKILGSPPVRKSFCRMSEPNKRALRVIEYAGLRHSHARGDGDCHPSRL